MENKSNIPTLQELKGMRKPVRNVNADHKEHLSTLEKLSLWITKHIGSMGFFIVIFVWTISWLAWNTFGPKDLRFDPFPAFVFWLFISNMIQILLMPLIMIGQNIQGRHAEARAEADFEVNIKAERETEAIILRLEKQTELLEKILERLEKS